MLDKPVVDNVEPEPPGKPGNNIFAERAHFARHCYNGHSGLRDCFPKTRPVSFLLVLYYNVKG